MKNIVLCILILIIIGLCGMIFYLYNKKAPLSYADKIQQELKDIIQKQKKHDKALLLVTFGSTWKSGQETFEKVKQSYQKDFPDYDVYLACTSRICISRCAKKGLHYYEPAPFSEALGTMGYHKFLIQSLHVIPGEEFQRVKGVVKDFHNSLAYPKFKENTVFLANPLMQSKEDINNLAVSLDKIFQHHVANNEVVIFMGHGNDDNHYNLANQRYQELENDLQKINPHYFVATVDHEGNMIEDAIERMKAKGYQNNKVICQPLMSIAGDHANNDMKGGNESKAEEGSWRDILNKEGYDCQPDDCILMGLADYPEIRNLWINHTKEVLKEKPMYEPK